MRKTIPLLSILILCAFTAMAQNIKGTVKDGEGKNIANASVSLLSAKDSSVVKLAVTDQNGQYQFKNIKDGRYMTNISYVGYKANYSPVFEVSGSGEVNVASAVITKLAGDLKNVTVTAQKPIIEVKADKTILNVENSIN
ncbi:MAG TPA: carboxypeptidase-like regulatory domain-containing protein, partial [Chitinophagaceae bacterium]|nr:carboxypeptidase-like regulatory domain-containing protein [Chitinophagaceae bacterium]